jgi:hypothetical protein
LNVALSGFEALESRRQTTHAQDMTDLSLRLQTLQNEGPSGTLKAA